MNRRWCSSKTLLCSSSSFLGAVLAVYYLCCQAVVATSSHHIINRYKIYAIDLSYTPCSSLLILKRFMSSSECLIAIIMQIPAAIERPAYPCDRKIIILYWTKCFGMTDFGFGTGRAPFVECPASNQASDRGKPARDINVNDLPPGGWRRLHHQHYVFLLYESPLHTDLKMLRQPLLRNYFNRTMTYRRDSDIVDLHTHGRMQCIDAASPSCIEFPRNTQNQIVQENHNSTSVPVKIDLSFKNRTVAWFVSHCNKHSRREALARNLSQFIPVDMFGTCAEASINAPTIRPATWPSVIIIVSTWVSKTSKTLCA